MEWVPLIGRYLVSVKLPLVVHGCMSLSMWNLLVNHKLKSEAKLMACGVRWSARNRQSVKN